MTSLFSSDCPTAGTCPACRGQRSRTFELPAGGTRREVCSWCEGCGFVMPERAAEWEAYEQQRKGRPG